MTSWIENQIVETVNGLNISDLSVDEAWLTASTDNVDFPPLWLYSISANCHKCPFQRINSTPILPNTLITSALKINSQYASRYRLRTDGNLSIVLDGVDDPGSLCEVHLSPGEFGVYELAVTTSQNNSIPKCSILTRLDPVNIYLPLFIFLLLYLVLIVGTKLVKIRYMDDIKLLFARINPWHEPSSVLEDNSTAATGNASAEAPLLAESHEGIDNGESIPVRVRKKASKRGARRKLNQQNLAIPSDPSSVEPTTSSPVAEQPALERPSRERFSSIDTFRGICIVIMIFVDDGGGLYYFFEHCTWDGLYVADLAFPWFLWIMGTCIPIAIQSQKNRGMPNFEIFKKICIRSIKLILIGIFLINTSSQSNPIHLETIRIPGVLQRFGISYFVISVLVLYFYSETSPQRIRHVIPWLFITICIILHTSIIFYLPVPGCPTGYLGPGGLHLNNKYPAHCIGGATGYIDRLLFTNNHIYQWPTAKKVYKSGPFDPEGSFGLLTSFLQVWLGVQVGVIFLTSQIPSKRLKRIILWSLGCISTGLILCGGPLNTGWIPINKNLWSLSFVLVTSGFAYLLISILYFVIDVDNQNYWSGFPFLEAGTNSILLYVGHEVFQNSLPWNFSIGKMSTHFLHLLENLWGTSLWVVIAVYLYHVKVFLVV